jgi:hypothetical protein
MKPTQKQINAALKYADDMLLDCEVVILAAAYRELLEKNREQKKYILELVEELDGWTSPD